MGNALLAKKSSIRHPHPCGASQERAPTPRQSGFNPLEFLKETAYYSKIDLPVSLGDARKATHNHAQHEEQAFPSGATRTL
jgi:hypothetical protein